MYAVGSKRKNCRGIQSDLNWWHCGNAARWGQHCTVIEGLTVGLDFSAHTVLSSANPIV